MLWADRVIDGAPARLASRRPASASASRAWPTPSASTEDIEAPSPASRSSRSSCRCCASSRRTCLAAGSASTCRSRYYLLFMPIGLIALLLPISISGIGAPQGIIVWLLAPAGVPRTSGARALDADRAVRDRRQPPRRLAVPAGGTIGASGRLAVRARGPKRRWSFCCSLAGGSCARLPHEKQPLLDVYMPSFSRVPPREPALQSIRTLAKDWRDGGRTNAHERRPVGAGRLPSALALAVILTVAWDFRRRGSSAEHRPVADVHVGRALLRRDAVLRGDALARAI